MHDDKFQTPKTEKGTLKKTEAQHEPSKLASYIVFMVHVPIVKLHKHFMIPSGEESDHWSSVLYAFEEHVFHLLHPLAGILIQLVVFGILYKVSWRVIQSLLLK